MIKSTGILSTLLELKVNLSRAAGVCVACLGSSATDGLCDPCRSDLPTNHQACPICALPMPRPDLVCGDCLANPPPYARAIIPWRYQFPADAMIRCYKDRGQRQFLRPLVTALGAQLADLLHQDQLTKPDILVPAPMHRRRRMKRGFNQAQVIAEELGLRLNIPVASTLVRRQSHVDSQRGLDKGQRLKNLQKVFEVTADIPERIAIVDDVVTTGATVRTLSALLEAHGAREIQVWALARTPL
ncbi:ComF family protein [Marinobacter salinisoli]|uniref:ComF family protein n=1 Tax=Marinobacter salinisoli TaxID=2769486 RepID=A0ABX7MQY5_9GAMM|nr:ComF family protein [Marinobacter salinisoli]QSP94564.1 ComF family protein [Marinobacter salinisoli]